MQGVITYRVARLEDAEQILEIYRPYVESTTVTFEYQVPSPEQFRERMETILKQYPYLVAEAGNKIVGYAYASSYRMREGYSWTPELSVYVRRDYHGGGIGTHLYAGLLDMLRLQGYQNVCSVVSWPNRGSEKLHQHFGFRFAGLQKKCAYKNGQWCDTAILERRLGDYPNPPAPPKPFPQLSQEKIERILKF